MAHQRDEKQVATVRFSQSQIGGLGALGLWNVTAWMVELIAQNKRWQDWSGQTCIRAEQAEDRAEKLERIGRRLLHADACGLSGPWQEAMDALKRTLDP